MQEIYKTVLEEVETMIVEKKSKFICSIKSVQTEEEALAYILSVKKIFYDAKHHCSAFVVGSDDVILERSNDDREPSGTAGKPMLEVLKGAGLRNVVAVVTRYFGGTLLGTGGLIKAYTESIKCAIEKATIYEKVLCEKLQVDTVYNALPKIEHEVHNMNQRIYEIAYSDKVTLTLLLECPIAENFKKTLSNLTNGQCKCTSEGFYYVSQINEKVLLERTHFSNY